MEKKQSGLAIASLVLGIIGLLSSCIVVGIVPCMIALVLAIITLTKKDVKHGLATTGLICSAIGIGIFVFMFVIVDIETEPTVENKQIVVEESKEEMDTPEDPGIQLEKEKIDVEIIKEYTLSDGINWYTRHFYIVKNNSDVTVDITTSSIAYNENGDVVGAADSEFYALGSGCTSVLYEAFETSETIAKYDTQIEYKESKYYESVIEDLSYIQNDIENGAVFQVTNNGTDSAEFVEGYALFFLGDELVQYESTYFVDDDSELKPEKTISEQMNCYDKFDRIEFYLTGRK